MEHTAIHHLRKVKIAIFGENDTPIPNTKIPTLATIVTFFLPNMSDSIPDPTAPTIIPNM